MFALYIQFYITKHGVENMALRGDWDEDSEEARAEDRKDALDERQEWMDIAEEEFIAEGDITASETVDGEEPTDLDDDGEPLEDFDDVIDEDEL